MPNAAKLLIHVDSVLNGGENFRVIAQKFVKNGLLPETYISVSEEKNSPVNTKIVSAFFSSHDFVYVKFDMPQSGHIMLLDIQGKEITSKRFSNSNVVNLYAPGLKPGMYILNLNANEIQRSLKVVK